MKTILTTIFILTLFVVVYPQKKVTDREFENLKGTVKSVRTDYEEIVNFRGVVSERKRLVEWEDFFDKDGRLTQSLSPNFNSRRDYNVIEGFKTYKYSPTQEKKVYRGFYSIVVPEGTPLEEPENLFPPDERYTEKFVYRYDSKVTSRKKEFIKTTGS